MSIATWIIYNNQEHLPPTCKSTQQECIDPIME
jgi:hypothetical protein